MSENTIVVVFPSIFAKNKIGLLITNIKKILKIKKQSFSSVKKDNDVIIVNADDPVFASSAINLLFGIRKIAIAKQTTNEFNSIVSEITKIGSNLLLKGEKFYVKVEGRSSGFIPKDVELAATSSLIEKTVELDVKPGTEDKHDKMIFAYITKSNSYVSIFADEGHGGIPYNTQDQQMICCVYDEFSILSCVEAIKEGFDVKLVVCYRTESELLKIVKMVNQILPRLLCEKIELEFFQIKIKNSSATNIQIMTNVVTEIALHVAKKSRIQRIGVPISNFIFPAKFVDSIVKRIFEKKIVPHIPLSGLDDDILDNAKNIGLEKYLIPIEKLARLKFVNTIDKTRWEKLSREAIKTQKSIQVKIGPNNIHDILDSL